MPKFKVMLQQYVEKNAAIEIEADTPKAAIDSALTNADKAEWTDGDDAYEVSAYAVLDTDNNAVWER